MSTLIKILIAIAVLVLIVAVWVGIPFAFGALIVWLGAPKWVGGVVGIAIFFAFLFSHRLKNN